MDLAAPPGLLSTLRERGYRLGGPVGVGAGGTAWSATAPDGERCVVTAVSLDLPIAARRAALERLEALRRVEHPHLAALCDVVALDSHRTALVTAAHDGPTLGAALAVRPRWSAGEVVTLLVPLAQALAALHDAGLAHGDAAPENVVLAPGGWPVLVDLTGAVVPTGGTSGFADPDQPRAGPSPAGDVGALARLGLAVLDDAAGHASSGLRALLTGVAGSRIEDRPAAADLAAACFAAGPPVPIAMPDPGELARVALVRFARPTHATRTVRTARGSRRRRRSWFAAALACCVAAAAYLTLSAPSGGEVRAPGDSFDPGDPVAAAVALTERRAAVLGAGEPGRLAEVVVLGSPAHTRDVALLAELAAAGVVVEDLAVQAVAARAVPGPRPGTDRAWVEVMSEVGAHRLTDAAGARAVAASPQRTVVLELVATPDGWRVRDVLAPEAGRGLAALNEERSTHAASPARPPASDG